MRKLAIFSTLGLLLLLANGSSGFAKTVKDSGSGNATFVTANFSYDLTADAVMVTGTGKDKLGTLASFALVELSSTPGAACTAPDQSAGTTFALLQSDAVTTYKKGQIYGTSTNGSECISNTTGSFSATITYTLAGGSGIYSKASGTVIDNSTGVILSAPSAGQGGFFGAESIIGSGTITF